jgi:hypothetical protein
MNQQRMQRIHDLGVYFVPEGDVFYYEALRAQIGGDTALAKAKYEEFLAQCKDTKYKARAEKHLAELKHESNAKKKPDKEPERQPDDDRAWP